MAFTVRSLLSLAVRVVRAASASPPEAPRRGAKRTRAPGSAAPAATRRTTGRRQEALLAYSPSSDGKPDPGEIVWTWVPYEDDPAQGKDRPVLLIGRDGGDLLGLMLTSRDRNNARDHDERYVDIGTGAWDRQGRPSEVKVDRLLRIPPADIRREGAVLPRRRFEQVLAAMPDHLLA
ncbi:type II toxin-antitoxin system PemK/MazF family toxin [Arthrobacter burdickii]|uniref:Type II toxin-antitoxin system PemK/MazF family toxin n=1 Tax=Arthrobacter burdickii TaxID=3035920 RepID=A0ABT8K3B9_9MICC|nr:type II toxin-antitoxin system PemK/MazF family toxin [Arthrobacter burdickii]MDN4611488.1 type II toxin-antitoxin system PemK/MazF family toxin [Arthrobacter burdickii]